MSPSLTQLLVVGAGGFLGTCLRFLLNVGVQLALPGVHFPLGTLAVNVLGCLAIGFLGGLADLRPILDPHLRLFVFVGVLGGFTTYSAFAYETLSLARDVDLSRALLNVALHIVLGLGAAWLGHAGALRLASS